MTDLGPLASSGGASVIDVTDAEFESEVINRSQTTPVVVDLWATWCGPCTTLGPILEKVITATEGRVVLAKVNVDENPAIARAFQVQSIPAVYAVSGGQVVDGFMGAVPEHEVQAFVDRLAPGSGAVADDPVTLVIEPGDELGMRAALEAEPANERLVVALAELLVDRGENDEALALLERVPGSDDARRIAAAARLASAGGAPVDDYDAQLEALLATVKDDDDARQKFVDILELMGPDDPRTAAWRKRLTATLF